jgi:hypothetical protein
VKDFYEYDKFNGAHFKQVADISLHEASYYCKHENGWTPIGDVAYPFVGIKPTTSTSANIHTHTLFTNFVISFSPSYLKIIYITLFFRKSENIKLLSQYMSKVASVNQKTLDLLILLLGASGRISEEYETILATIDELGSLNGNEAQVLNYLLKVKKMVNEIHDSDTKMTQIIEDTKRAKESVNEALDKINQEVKESEKSRKIVESKCIKLQKQIKFNNLYIGICLLMIIVLSVFIGFKFYVF